MKDELMSKVPGTWLEVDFHVHSPGSFDFQGTGNDEAGYIWLLEQASLAKLDIIVLTDHNDIAGYFKLEEIKNDLRSTVRILERNSSPIPDTILSQIALFERVTVLPGVELDVYPNIHFIIVFDPQRIDEISTFLSSAGYTPEVRGNEKSSAYCKWPVAEVLQESEKINAIVIAAHIDSDKGLYEASKKWGQSRVAAFANENLYGMEFLHPTARDQIESIMKAPAYARNTRLAFVQSSDFHGRASERLGERRTYVRMDDVDRQDKASIFQSLKRALRNPDEFISAPGRPELKAILEKLADQPYVENIDCDDDRRRLIQYVCAYANTEDGTIVIGRNSKGNWVGEAEKNEKEFVDKVAVAIKMGITPQPNTTLQVYPYYGNNYVATIRVKRNPHICALSENDRVYMFDAGQPKQASSKEIVELVESRLIERYAHLSITSRLSEMSQKLLGTEDSIDILPIVRKIDKRSVPLRMALNPPKLGEILSDDLLMHGIELDGNGCSDGNILVLSRVPPRHPKHYVRVSAPVGCFDSETADKRFVQMARFSGEKMIVVAGGAVYYDNHDDIVIGCLLYPPLVLTEVGESYSASLKFVTAYLKSSIAVWYAERCLGSYDMRKALIQNMPVPDKVPQAFQENVVNLLDAIRTKEDEFLAVEADLYREYGTPESRRSAEFRNKREGLLNPHNAEADKIMGEIDELFYAFFGLSNTEKEMVEQVIKSSGLAVFPKQNIAEQ